ncbi:MAG: molybdopterin dinucleotide binding domain-containing protein [Pseudomonadales bacterium]
MHTGNLVTRSSNTGAINTPVEVTDNIMPGVVCMPHSSGNKRQGNRLSVANHQHGVSMNDITVAKFIDELSGNCVVHGVPAKISHAV